MAVRIQRAAALGRLLLLAVFFFASLAEPALAHAFTTAAAPSCSKLRLESETFRQSESAYPAFFAPHDQKHIGFVCHDNPVNMVDPSGHEGELSTTLAAVGIAANMVFTGADAIRLRDAQIRGNPRDIAEASTYLSVDILLLAVPFSGTTGTLGRGGAVAVESYLQASTGIATRLRGAWAGIRTLVLFSQIRGNGGDSGDTPSSNSSTGRQDGSHSGGRAYDSARESAFKNAGDLGSDTFKMHDPETGTLIGEMSRDGKRGWRLDEGHFNWWDWTGGKKGTGGKFGHEFFEGETGPHSEHIGYAEWQ